MKKLIVEVLSILSRLLNVLTGGTADLSFSARSHKNALWTEHWIDEFFWLLRSEIRHCRSSWQVEVERSKEILKATGIVYD